MERKKPVPVIRFGRSLHIQTARLSPCVAEEKNLMAIAFTFPGQGSQALGMGKDLADAFPEAAAVFAEVDEALGEKLSDIMWNGPEETLTLTANAQPALMAVSIAAIRVLEAKGLDLKSKVAYVAGHSLGEYSALCAVGTFSLADTARLLRIRGNAMQAAVPVGKGAMAAIIGLEHGDVEAVCVDASGLGSCQIANDNGGGQLVISGEKAAVEKAAMLATEKGAKRAILLPVSAPFHSALMTPAADAMRDALATVAKNDPVVPLIANVRAAPVTDASQIASLLVEQVTGQVRWRETVEWFAANGVTTLYEIGSGKVLTGLARRIDKTVTGIAVNSPADIDAALQTLLA
jgi:[acyl-carrier-protein] S-malonyltransferase